ncbi:Na-K-Cl cotransporter [hydrothermal vent metagenome]|uniref:Na-K-Cl cotransporter n=1 Tax=hydrothermal vent metagenome TaxID=652676 RepID=A0A3B1CZJ5_9ZZZZ
MALIKHLSKKHNANSDYRRLGTFGGVFTPDVLTILGVIMYLRLGWVVGNAGLLGAIAIILLAKVITITTGLSMSSITTNIKIGAGGAYSIISKSLGLEAGGSIGIPFYISQSLSAALYIAGFTEGWLMIFPHHPAILVSFSAWLVLMAISYVSTVFAIRVQYFILGIILLSIVSFLLSPYETASGSYLIGTFDDANFWEVFAVFFPAVTGIMAGANLSGELRNPRKAIPKGTLSAIGVTMIIYIILAYGLSVVASPEELRSDQMIMVDKAWWGPVVIIGILAATFSSALGSLIGAPRILQALAEHKTIIFHKFFDKKAETGEPRNAIVFTGLFILIPLSFGDFNALATLITMFFLITYGTLNLVVFIQQSMRIISFRPTFKIPKFVPLIGFLGSNFIIFLIDPIFGIIAIITIIAIYYYLTKQGLNSEWGDIRGGMFLALAEKASRIASKFPLHQIVWKPDILLPIENPEEWGGPLLFIRNITHPVGSIFAFTVKPTPDEKSSQDLKELLMPLDNEGILVNSTVIEDSDFIHGSKLVIQTLKAGAFRPNTLFLTLGSNPEKDAKIQSIVDIATKYELGTLILRQHPRVAFGLQNDVNIWLRDRSPNWHLAILITLQLQSNWGGKINLVTVAENDSDKKRLHSFLYRLSDQTRLPSLSEFYVLTGSFNEALQKAPRADMNIFGVGHKFEFDFMRKTTELTKSSCLFVKDSGNVSALV